MRKREAWVIAIKENVSGSEFAWFWTGSTRGTSGATTLPWKAHFYGSKAAANRAMPNAKRRVRNAFGADAVRFEVWSTDDLRQHLLGRGYDETFVDMVERGGPSLPRPAGVVAQSGIT